MESLLSIFHRSSETVYHLPGAVKKFQVQDFQVKKCRVQNGGIEQHFKKYQKQRTPKIQVLRCASDSLTASSMLVVGLQSLAQSPPTILGRPEIKWNGASNSVPTWNYDVTETMLQMGLSCIICLTSINLSLRTIEIHSKSTRTSSIADRASEKQSSVVNDTSIKNQQSTSNMLHKKTGNGSQNWDTQIQCFISDSKRWFGWLSLGHLQNPVNSNPRLDHSLLQFGWSKCCISVTGTNIWNLKSVELQNTCQGNIKETTI